MDLKKELKNINIDIDDDMQSKFEKYYNILVDYNEKVNLTAITEYDEVMIKHFFDSLCLSTILKNDNIKLVDIGAGAGFPSVPNAIYNKNLDVTIVDSLNKRITFLNYLKDELNISNFNAVHARAEEYVIDKRESFDVATARAVARLNILAELCMPYVKVGGLFIAFKSQNASNELDEAKKCIELLGGKIIESKTFTLPYDMGERELIIIKKIKNTPIKYPRKFNIIKKNPL